ncbi:MAG TPA: hypothetical protein VGM90_35180 [Kofleriaceae bacterium]|jgi:hypothetical protein
MLRRLVHPSFALVIVVGCLGKTADYSPDQDVQAFDEIARTYRADGGFELSLCEDVTAPGRDESNTCVIEHVVRGDGSAPKDSESHGGGCGGCPFDNVAYVRGVVSGTGLAQPLSVTGTVYLGAGAGADPYDYPYNVELACAAPAMCSLSGQLDEHGILTIDYVNVPGLSQTLFAFVPTEQAVCSAPAP